MIEITIKVQDNGATVLHTDRTGKSHQLIEDIARSAIMEFMKNISEWRQGFDILVFQNSELSGQQFETLRNRIVGEVKESYWDKT